MRLNRRKKEMAAGLMILSIFLSGFLAGCGGNADQSKAAAGLFGAVGKGTVPGRQSEYPQKVYQNFLKEYGGGNYGMGEEEIRETFGNNLPDQAFTFVTREGKRFYLKSRNLNSGGRDFYLWSINGEEWVREGDFSSYLAEEDVICIEGNYYYIGLKTDGIRLIRLEESMEWRDTLTLNFIPGEYERYFLFSLEEERDKEVAEYIENLEAEFLLDQSMSFYGGTEEQIKSEETGNTEYFRADVMNTGLPLYIKRSYERDTVHKRSYLKIDFYGYDEQVQQFLWLDTWDGGDSGDLWREYFWCENLGEKIYIFQLLGQEDDTYIFEVFLLEESGTTLLHREAWMPERVIQFRRG
ncbi:MAG: hypothetical protein IJP31_07395 [Lachnospiraceae bacterium]|nr:hypothetical protein [Lachnospiraceae bacterium]